MSLHYQRNILMTGAAALFALTASCASDVNSFAETVGDEGAEESVLADRWSDGKDLQNEGEELAKEADKLQRKGAEDMRKGRNLIASGEAAVATQKERYRETVRGFGLAITPAQLKSEIDTLQSIQDKWKTGREQIARGEKLIREGEQQTAEAEDKSRRAETLIARGTQQMRAAEARYDPGDGADAGL